MATMVLDTWHSTWWPVRYFSHTAGDINGDNITDLVLGAVIMQISNTAQLMSFLGVEADFRRHLI